MISDQSLCRNRARNNSRAVGMIRVTFQSTQSNIEAAQISFQFHSDLVLQKATRQNADA